MKILELCNITVRFNKEAVIENFSYSFVDGTVYFLTSPNGTGKTTLFNVIIDEINYEGKVKKDGLHTVIMPDQTIYPPCIQLKNFIKLFIDKENYEYINEYLRKFNILKYQNKNMQKASKGTKQKALIIKTLLEDVDIYLFDEPLNGLDVKSRQVFIEEVNKLRLNNKIIIIATHYYDEYDFEEKMIVSL